MKKMILKQRATAVERYLAGEDPVSICASLGKTKHFLDTIQIEEYKYQLR